MLSNKQEIFSLIKKNVFFFDLDGTIYLENELFQGVLDLINRLQKAEKKFYFLSNNSSKSTRDYLKKLKRLGLPISLENIILSQHPTMRYLKDNGFQRIFLLGTASLKKEFTDNGFILTDKDPQILVLAFDQELTYQRLVRASELLFENVPYIATHLDDRCPVQDNYIPDAGGIAALLEKTTIRTPKVFGKPSKEMILFKLREIHEDPSHAIMFGDRLYTDIKMGIAAGIETCCVLSGETTLETIKSSDTKPTYIINGIWELLQIFL